MVNNLYIYNNWNNFGGISILNKKYILYGLGIGNLSVKEFFEKNNVKYVEYIDGKDIPNSIFNDIDYVIKSSGIKFNTLFLNKAIENNIKVISDLELYYLLNKEDELIIVTGTNGKTTTSTLISNLLNDQKICTSGVYGNIGIPLLSKKENGLTIIEASSFMLHNCYKIKPHIYLITSLIPHHLDYHIKEEDYFYDKLKIINNMEKEDYLIYNLDYENITKNLNNPKCKILTYSLCNSNADIYIEGNNVIFNNNEIMSIEDINRNEPHNLENMLATILVGIIYNIDFNNIKKSLINFKGIEHRLEYIIENDNYIIINDSKSTSPASLEKAIDSIKIKNYNDYFKILILGGKIVDENYRDVNKKISLFDNIFIFGKDKFKYYKYIKHDFIFAFDSLDELIVFMKNKIKKPLLVLFSPSSPSYDLYENFEKRGEHLKNLIFYHNFCK